MSLTKPGDSAIAEFLDRQRESPFSYAEVGATRGDPPRGYAIDRHSVQLAKGPTAVRRAREAIDRWAMFDADWIEVHPHGGPISAGINVAVLARILGVSYLNACRIVYVIDETGPIETYGFAYGTLRDHAEKGEERFTVIWDHADDSVRYEQFAFSRPNHLLTHLYYPLARTIQKRFARDALAAMARAVGRTR
ncbi:MAG: DUF1990 domain-containing protein [Chloroflexi bacterium]|nr:MAG: DUF1990 domain-containing protein [Chloroflexota bacterium]